MGPHPVLLYMMFTYVSVPIRLGSHRAGLESVSCAFGVFFFFLNLVDIKYVLIQCTNLIWCIQQVFRLTRIIS